MRVWLATGNMNAGGVESLIMEILRNRPEDITIEMLIHTTGDDYSGMYDQEIKALGINILTLPSVGSVGITDYTKQFVNLVSKTGCPDLIHIHLNAVSGVIARAAKIAGVPIRIIHCHANIKYRGSKLYVIRQEILLFLMKFFVNKYGTHYWACSEPAAKRLFNKTKQYSIIPNVIDVPKYLSSAKKRLEERKRLGVDDSVYVIGAVGRIAPIKNYEVIIRAIAELNRADTHFYIYGREQNSEYVEQLRELGKYLQVDDRIHYLGNSDRVSDVIAAFDLYVMPSISEGLGISAVEAQAAGLPTFLSLGVPDEAVVIPQLVRKLPFDSPTDWACSIAKKERMNVSNESIMQAFQEKHFDSKTGCAEIYKLYEQYQRQHKK